MSTTSKELKSRAFIDQHNLREHVILNEANSFDIPADLYADVVLKGAEITLDQLKKKERLEGELLASVTLLGGEQAVERFKSNPELSEIGFSMPMGSSHVASGIFSREGKDHTVVTVNNKIGTAEMKRVLGHLNTLFDDISS